MSKKRHKMPKRIEHNKNTTKKRKTGKKTCKKTKENII